MKTGLWLSIVAVAGLLSYSVGFVISKQTGVEPGFFEKAESGGYGVSADSSVGGGVSADMQDHYKQLTE